MSKDDFRERMMEDVARAKGDIKTLFRDGENRDKQMEKIITLIASRQNNDMNRLNAVIGFAVTIILGLIAVIYKG